MKTTIQITLACAAIFAVGCNKGETPAVNMQQEQEELVSLQDVARFLSSVSLGTDRMDEVHDAVSNSSSNGYDEEYMLGNLLDTPGCGVGDEKLSEESKASQPQKTYSRPMKDLFAEWCGQLASSRQTKSSIASSAPLTAEDYLNYLKESDIQIYWPESEGWDGQSAPVITFAPSSDAVVNVGYTLREDGSVEELLVDEEMASQRPVWVINRNDDSPYMTLDVMKKNDPSWEEGGSLVIDTKASKASSSSGKMLILKKLKMLQHYDSWFAGASEFMIKMGAVESFNASTEAELKLYNPEVTDFMVVVKRRELGVDKEVGVMLVSDWTDQLEDCAFLIIEDDGGTITSWKTSATVKIKSKSYGFDIDLPIKSYDDLVWRGKLNRRYLESGNTVTGRFGGTDITFEVKDY